MNRVMWIVVFIVVCVLAGLVGCAGVGPEAAQTVDSIRERSYGPSQTRLVDRERGTLTTSGTGPTGWQRLDENGVESNWTGIMPRTIKWSQSTGDLVLNSGTDIAAGNVDVVKPDGTRISIKNFTTLASEPTRAVNEAYRELGPVWASYSNDQREAHIAAIQGMTNIAQEFKAALIADIMSLPR